VDNELHKGTMLLGVFYSHSLMVVRRWPWVHIKQVWVRYTDIHGNHWTQKVEVGTIKPVQHQAASITNWLHRILFTVESFPGVYKNGGMKEPPNAIYMQIDRTTKQLDRMSKSRTIG